MNQIFFLQPHLLVYWGSETSLQHLHKYCILVQIDCTRHLVLPYHPFTVCFIAHVGWQHWPSGQGCFKCSWKKSASWAEMQWFVTSQVTCPVKAGTPSRGCTGGNSIKGLAVFRRQSLGDRQWFCCWKCHSSGSYSAAGCLKYVICTWYQSQWNYWLWIIHVENSGSLHTKF